MLQQVKQWLAGRYTKAVNSIAFYPIFISVSLALLSFALYFFRQNIIDEWIKQNITFLGNADADNLRSLMNVVTGGSISISVFSFSMVMVVLSQASQTYSPKILDGITKNKRPQRILGFYIGTVVYCLPQLLLISEQYERSISPLAILIALGLAVLNMFFFIEFIDFISNMIKPTEICRSIYRRTRERLRKESDKSELDNGLTYAEQIEQPEADWKSEQARQSGYYQGLNEQQLSDLCLEEGIQVKIANKIGMQVLKYQRLFYYNTEAELTEETRERLHGCFHFYDVEDIEKNFVYGFRELAEIGAKALSPGVNDIGTARISLDLLIDLIAEYARTRINEGIVDEEGKLLVLFMPNTMQDIFESCLDEIRIYATEDKNITMALLSGCKALFESNEHENPFLKKETIRFAKKMKKDIEHSKALSLDADYLLEYYSEHLEPNFS
jgi:uncharacterized membrane protein